MPYRFSDFSPKTLAKIVDVFEFSKYMCEFFDLYQSAFLHRIAIHEQLLFDDLLSCNIAVPLKCANRSLK